MANILVLAEHDQGHLKLTTLSAVAFAAKVTAEAGGSFDILVIGENVAATVESLRPYGAAVVLSADHAQLKNPLADKYAQIVSEIAMARASTMVVGTASTFSKD